MRFRPSAFLFLTAAILLGCDKPSIERVGWTSMSTVAAVQSVGTAEPIAALAETVQAEFAEVERLLNAFDPSSELSRLAAQSDERILAECNPSVRECYAAAFAIRDESGGVFNPRWRGAGTMDLGAIAKGFAVDRAAARMKLARGGRVLVDLGGNLKAVGGDWQVGINGGEAFTLHDGEACATSGEYYRGKHIRDGRNGGDINPAQRSVTVVHPASAMRADALSTLLFILGREKGEAFLREHGECVRVYWQE